MRKETKYELKVDKELNAVYEILKSEKLSFGSYELRRYGRRYSKDYDRYRVTPKQLYYYIVGYYENGVWNETLSGGLKQTRDHYNYQVKVEKEMGR